MIASHKVADFPLILLAGGSSSRMGQAKGLLPVKGRPFLSWQLSRFRAAGGTRAIVVTGAHAQVYRDVLGYAAAAESAELRRPDVCNGLGIRFIENPAWELGPLSSLIKGIEIYSGHEYQDALGAFVSPVDVPLATSDVWRDLARHFSMRLAAVKPVYKSRGGHPVLLTDFFLQRLRDVDLEGADARLDVQLRHLPAAEIVRLPVQDPQIRQNLNTPEAWDTWLRALR